MSGKILLGDCLELMKGIPDGSIDMTVTSPPYDNLRTYNGTLDWGEQIWKPVIEELYRVTKDSGVVVWVVGDATVNGSETGSSFKQALYFKEIGFNLHDTMIYKKTNFAPYDPKCMRYYQEFEYMFVFSKGKPKTCNYIYEPCKHAGCSAGGYNRNPDGLLRLDRKEKGKGRKVLADKIKANIWEYSNTKRVGHPAPFPSQLATDHIISWSNEGDTVFDPFAGSGTTAIACINTNRKYICMEKDETYYKVMCDRVAAHV